MNTFHRYAVVDSAGRIRSIRSGPYQYVPCDETVGDDTHFVSFGDDGPEFRERQPLDYSSSVDGLTLLLSGLPEGAVVSVAGGEVVADTSGIVEVEFDIPGDQHVLIRAPLAYRDEELEVTIG